MIDEKRFAKNRRGYKFANSLAHSLSTLWMKSRKTHAVVASPLVGEMSAKPTEGFEKLRCRGGGVPNIAINHDGFYHGTH
jgi:hypothetical protein